MQRPPFDVQQRLNRIKAARQHASQIQGHLIALMASDGEKVSSKPDHPAFPLAGDELWFGSLQLLDLEETLVHLSNAIRSDHGLPAVQVSSRMESQRRAMDQLVSDALKEIRSKTNGSQTFPQSC
jgi:hypothetical protein